MYTICTQDINGKNANLTYVTQSHPRISIPQVDVGTGSYRSFKETIPVFCYFYMEFADAVSLVAIEEETKTGLNPF